jgi:hypothetical protein
MPNGPRIIASWKDPGTLHGGDLAGQLPANAEVARAPGHTVAERQQTACDPLFRDCRFAPMDVARQMHFHAPRQIENALQRRRITVISSRHVIEFQS